MPNLFTVCGYRIYFWSNEAGEPVHVHIAKGKPIPNATKVWLTRAGGCILASNQSRIPKHELDILMEFIAAQFPMICEQWKEFFIVDILNFYC